MPGEAATLEIYDGIATVTMNRPERMNCLDFETCDAVLKAIKTAVANADTKVIILRGSGRAFCAGGDVKGMCDAKEPERFLMDIASRIHRIVMEVQSSPKLVIAAVNGVATGAGMDLALMCDIRYAAQSARFAETYIKVGLVPGAGGAHFLPRLVGVSKALELFFTGDFVDATEALRIGIVNKVFPDATLMEEVEKIARRMCQAPGLTLRMTKRAIYQGMRNDLRTNLDLISSHYAVITSTEAHKTLVRSFIAARDKKRS